jgi:hypothetical protein
VPWLLWGLLQPICLLLLLLTVLTVLMAGTVQCTRLQLLEALMQVLACKCCCFQHQPVHPLGNRRD